MQGTQAMIQFAPNRLEDNCSDPCFGLTIIIHWKAVHFKGLETLGLAGFHITTAGSLSPTESKQRLPYVLLFSLLYTEIHSLQSQDQRLSSINS